MLTITREQSEGQGKEQGGEIKHLLQDYMKITDYHTFEAKLQT